MRVLILLGVVASALGHFPAEVYKTFGDTDFKYGYEPYNGPNVWQDYYPACGNQKQSPIALPDVRYESADNEIVEKLFHENYDQPCCVLLENKGTTFDFNCKEKAGEKPRLTGGSLYHPKRRFKFYSGHIHWGKDNTDGSEHSIGGIKHQAEVHLIHYDAKFDSVIEALEEPGAIIVQAFFLQYRRKDNPNFDWLLDNLYKINGTEVQADIGVQPLFDAKGRSVFQPNSNSFYVYEGSLTTPPCNEVVVFHVYTTPTPISERQLNILRSLVDKDGNNMSGNFRNIQPLYDRRIMLRAAKHVQKPKRVHKYDFRAEKYDQFDEDFDVKPKRRISIHDFDFKPKRRISNNRLRARKPVRVVDHYDHFDLDDHDDSYLFADSYSNEIFGREIHDAYY